MTSKNFSLFTVLMFPTLLSLLWSDAGRADIQRSCHADYYIKFVSVNGMDVAPEYRNLQHRFGSLTGTGGCGNMVPNRCRERAYERLKNCVQGWAEGLGFDVPKQIDCDGVTGTVSDLQPMVIRAACCARATPDGRSEYLSVRVDVGANFWGDRNCGANYHGLASPIPRGRRAWEDLSLKRGFDIDCRAAAC